MSTTEEAPVLEEIVKAATVPGWWVAKARYKGVIMLGLGETREKAQADLRRAMRIWPRPKP
mgnify:CR=1 FL=1